MILSRTWGAEHENNNSNLNRSAPQLAPSWLTMLMKTWRECASSRSASPRAASYATCSTSREWRRCATKSTAARAQAEHITESTTAGRRGRRERRGAGQGGGRAALNERRACARDGAEAHAAAEREELSGVRRTQDDVFPVDDFEAGDERARRIHLMRS